jgi:hypothetical protein
MEDNEMVETQVIKIEVGAKYVLIIKNSLTDAQAREYRKIISDFLLIGDVKILMIDGLDCTLEKIEPEIPTLKGNVERP